MTDVINCGGVVGRGGTTGGGLSSSAMDCCLSLTMMYCFYTSYFTTHSKRQQVLYLFCARRRMTYMINVLPVTRSMNLLGDAFLIGQ